ncbi:diacylglycerol/lipid kinase family protein [Solitalea canadensis]|uniref:Sphingosine/diacylglycerol kinase-like enzyme n=1 Tax=Solitalea canadensis (strain ATCC 29591 / DSM 3403 / JCM 21819 / LMG 8368 / NBRC 15130 / NCIMB 12057 / USAM 9D) TaxID=929556 RepID=H8KQL9_SOLCM|nr:diacylglycerol kinase family protein [Solitalea canadensis]AFD06757.1 sphingosine/diacylglycerol kinase-like enzyme [Solitalea canadensis DSM 3403]
MKIAHLLHNPTAGNEEHSKKNLISLIENQGFDCRYSSTKSKDWNIAEDTDFLVVAGGDGTVKKITKILLERKVLEKSWPIALLPLGTANNIAKTLELPLETEQIIKSWKKPLIKKYDVGRLYAIKNVEFFLESFGYGVFPYLMLEMVRQEKESIEDPEEKIKEALKLLLEILDSYEARLCDLQIDGKDYSGKYLMVEIMNTKSIGPNLVLSPDSDPGDSKLNIVIIGEKHRKKLLSYIEGKIDGEKSEYKFDTIEGENISIRWEGTHVHVDDKVVKVKKSAEVKIKLIPDLLNFIVPS